jgi:hypothetical protein
MSRPKESIILSLVRCRSSSKGNGSGSISRRKRVSKNKHNIWIIVAGFIRTRRNDQISEPGLAIRRIQSLWITQGERLGLSTDFSSIAQ